jgi:hypothetical protein
MPETQPTDPHESILVDAADKALYEAVERERTGERGPQH